MNIALGLGCDRGTPVETIVQAVYQALQQAKAVSADIVALASIDLKADESGLLALAAKLGCPDLQINFYSAAQLADVAVPNPSETVRRYTGTPSVSEAAALLAAGRENGPAPVGALLVEKHKLRGADGKHATVSVACVEAASPASENR